MYWFILSDLVFMKYNLIDIWLYFTFSCKLVIDFFCHRLSYDSLIVNSIISILIYVDKPYFFYVCLCVHMFMCVWEWKREGLKTFLEPPRVVAAYFNFKKFDRS